MTDRRFINHQYLDQNGRRLKVQCRFCRSIQQFNKYSYVCPCACAQSTRFVHRSCLQRWIQVKFEHVYNNGTDEAEEFNIFCEVCRQRMEIEFVIKRKCRNYRDFVQSLIERKICFGIQIIMTILSLTAIILISIIAVKEGYDQLQNNKTKMNALIIGFSISCFLLLVAILSFFWIFVLIKSIDITKIPNHKGPIQIVNKLEKDELTVPDNSPFHYEGSRDINLDKSIINSKRVSERGSEEEKNSSSAVSKTLTDYVMKDIYHNPVQYEDEPRPQQLIRKQTKINSLQRQESHINTKYLHREESESVLPKSSINQKKMVKESKRNQQKYFASEIEEKQRKQQNESEVEKEIKKANIEEQKVNSRKIKLKQVNQPIKVRLVF